MALRSVPVVVCLALASALPVAAASGQSTAGGDRRPVTRHRPIAGFTRLPTGTRTDYQALDGDVRIVIYQFRPLTVDLAQHVQRNTTLEPSGAIARFLAEFLPAADRDTRNLEPPSVAPLCGPNIYPAGGGPPCKMIGEGADQIWGIRYREDDRGATRSRTRYIVRKDDYATVIDVVWRNEAARQRMEDSVRDFTFGFKIIAPGSDAPAQAANAPSTAAGGGRTGALVPGMYMGAYQRFRPTVGGIGGSFAMDSMFFLFSENGRVYRAFDTPVTPGGDVRRFDYDGARQRDPANSGTYSVSGEQVTIQMGSETIAATLLPGGSISIDSKEFRYVATR